MPIDSRYWCIIIQSKISRIKLSFQSKNRIFYISQGLLFAIPVVYGIKLWNITGILGSDTLSLFWDYLLPLNIAIAVSIVLLLTLITLTSPSKNKLNFAPIIIGSIVSVLWWARIYQKCMDKSILFTSSNTVDMQIYLFYIGAAILIVLITVGVTLYTVKEHKLSV